MRSNEVTAPAEYNTGFFCNTFPLPAYNAIGDKASRLRHARKAGTVIFNALNKGGGLYFQKKLQEDRISCYCSGYRSHSFFDPALRILVLCHRAAFCNRRNCHYEMLQVTGALRAEISPVGNVP